MPTERLRACGLSGAKSAAIRALAARAACGEVDFAAIRGLPDGEAAERLRAIKGFGPWSTEMFLIFALGRDDIYSVGDGGLRRAVCALYRVSERQYERRVSRIAEAWRPWRSLACRYLWAWLDRDAARAAQQVARGTMTNPGARCRPGAGGRYRRPSEQPEADAGAVRSRSTDHEGEP